MNTNFLPEAGVNVGANSREVPVDTRRTGRTNYPPLRRFRSTRTSGDSLNKLLKIAVALGLLLAWKSHGVEYPPLPVAPGKPLVDVPGSIAKPLFATWDVSAACLDVLEISPCPDFEASVDIPGPYDVRDINGVLSYYVPVPVGYSKAFFRVRRYWGNPWILPVS